MGLFGKKQECPICGEPTPRLLPTEIEGQPICKECSKKASMQRQILEKITLEEYKEHLGSYLIIYITMLKIVIFVMIQKYIKTIKIDMNIKNCLKITRIIKNYIIQKLKMVVN